MPVNPTLEYQKAERKYHEARTLIEKIKALEEMLRTCPKHKGSEGLQQEIKQKLSKLRALQEKQKTSGSRYQISVKKEGAAQVVILGVPNSGKSTLLSKLTNAKPEIAQYPFTTKLPEVGVMDYEGVKIQVVEIPAVTTGFSVRDLGPTFLGIVRQAELIIIIANDKSELKLIRNEMANSNIITDKKRPKIIINKTSTGGLISIGKIKAKIDDVKKILRKHGIHNCIVEFQEQVTLEDLEEVITEGTAYVNAVIVSTKNKAKDIKKKIWKNLGLIKVYTKQPRKKKDYPPIALKKGSTVKDLALRVHKDFIKKFTKSKGKSSKSYKITARARIWGASAKYPGIMVGAEHVLHNEDVVELHKPK